MSKKEEKKAQFIKDAFNKMFTISGYEGVTYEVLCEMEAKEIDNDSEPWYQRYTMTNDQLELFKTWFINELGARFRFSKKKSREYFGEFNFKYGLKINNDEEIIDYIDSGEPIPDYIL